MDSVMAKEGLRHGAAWSAALALHIGVMGWAALPSDAPVGHPPWPAMEVTLVTPTVIAQEVVQTKVASEPEMADVLPPAMDAPPKKTKRQPSPVPTPTPVPVAKSKSTLQERQIKPTASVNHTRLTSGPASPQATARHSAESPPAADYLKNPPPHYPRRARLRNQQGTVMLGVSVGVDGRPRDILIKRSSGYDVLDMAALSAVRRWKFVPARRGGEHVEASLVIPIEFRIN